jgi:hypothetical protein
MKLKGIIFEDFVNYKKICMTLEFPYCSFKCDKECEMAVCQNSQLAQSETYDFTIDEIIKTYIDNPITEAICCQGLEPLDSFDELINFIDQFRKICNDDIVIFTGYTEDEVKEKQYLTKLKNYDKIILKYGRFIPNRKSRYDEVLGISLASDNQYVRRLINEE